MNQGHYHEERVNEEFLKRLEAIAPRYGVWVKRLSKGKYGTRVAISAGYADLGAFWKEVRGEEVSA